MPGAIKRLGGKMEWHIKTSVLFVNSDKNDQVILFSLSLPKDFFNPFFKYILKLLMRKMK